jgi:formylglycine-generating enzyme required for sulfatase activity
VQHKREQQLELAVIEARNREADYLKAMAAGESPLAEAAYDRAISHFKNTLNLKPNDRDAEEKCQIAEKFKLDIQRELAAAEARKLEQRYQELMQNGAEALEQKNYQLAMSQYQKALEFKPKDISAIEKYQFALSQTPAELLVKYAPGLQLIEIKAGDFRMGDLSGKDNKLEMPVCKVQIKPFSLTKHEITFEQFDLYAEETGKAKPDDQGWGRGTLPVINITWRDASDYAEWLSQRTGQKFRLPSEADWEYAARSGTTTKFYWGDDASHEHSNYGTDECCDGLAEGFDQWLNTSPVGSFPANQFNLHDLHGNVWEWVQDCWNDSYVGASLDSKARLSGNCKLHVVRGGSWFNGPKRGLEARWRRSETGQYNYLGFRLAMDR